MFCMVPNTTGFLWVLPRLEGKGKEFWSYAFEIGQRLIKSIFGYGGGVLDIALSAHVPLPKMTGRIS